MLGPESLVDGLWLISGIYHACLDLHVVLADLMAASNVFDCASWHWLPVLSPASFFDGLWLLSGIFHAYSIFCTL
jgi:hypothetical protein